MSSNKFASSQSLSPLHSTKHTDEVSSSPSCLLTPRPQAADKGPPRPGNLYLPDLGAKRVSRNQTSERATCLRKPTPQEALPKTPLDYSLKLNDEIEAALKAPIQEPEPLIEMLDFNPVPLRNHAKCVSSTE